MSIPDGTQKALEQVLEEGPIRPEDGYDYGDMLFCRFCDHTTAGGQEIEHDPDCPWESLVEWVKQQMTRKEDETEPILVAIQEELVRADKKHGRGSGIPDCIRITGNPTRGNPDHVAFAHGIAPAYMAQRACKHAGFGLTNAHILVEEVAEAVEAAAYGAEDSLEQELVQVGAMAVKWIREIRRRRTEASKQTKGNT